MANKRNTRSKIVGISVNAQRTIGAPTSDLVVEGDLTGAAFDTNFRCTSVKGTFAIRGLTPGEGPIQVGFSHNDYDATEIAEALDATSATDRGNKIAQEQRNRLVRNAGSLPGIAAEEVLNDGKPIKQKLNWILNTGNTLAMWMRNLSGSTNTTGATLEFQGTIFGYWLD